MTGFVIGAAALLALAWWMLRGAWRTAAPLPPSGEPASAAIAVLRDQLAALDQELAAGQLSPAQHRAAQRDLQRRVLDEGRLDAREAQSWPGVAHSTGARSLSRITLLFLPALALACYAAIGNPAGIVWQAPPGVSAAAAQDEAEVSPAVLEAMLASLAQRLQTPSADPAADAQGWTMLGRSYASLQRFDDAERALARASALAPQDAQLLADRADVLAMLQEQRLQGEPERLIAQALQLDPQNLKALSLAGTAAYQRQDLGTARRHWQLARSMAPAGSDFAAGLDRSLAEVGGAQPPAPAAETGAAPIGRITGRVTLSTALAARAAPGDTVFVFARAASGSSMPLAIVRATVAELPLQFVLDDRAAMSPALRLSGAERVIVGARISRSGNAMAQSGDLHAETAPMPNHGTGLQLVIDRVQP